MKVVVATSDVPFVEGGHLIIARELTRAINEYGYKAELILTPQNRFSRVFHAYIATRFIDVQEDGVGEKIDKLISFKYPSYALKHPEHIVWINHRMREYYDLWENFYAKLGRRAKIKERIKKFLIHKIDNYLLKKVKKIYSQSENIKKRLEKWGKIKSSVLYPPPPKRNYKTEDYKNTIFTVSRLVKHKRVDLIIKALKYVKNKEIKLIIAGEGPELNNLMRYVKESGLEKRVSFLGRISDDQLIKNYAECGAVFYSPYNEDYGFVTVEAFTSGKAVITTNDSGGVYEIISKSKGGIYTKNDPQTLGEKIDDLFSDKNKLIALGETGKQWVSSLTWEKTVETLILNK